MSSVIYKNINKINKIYGTTLFIKKLEKEIENFEVYIFQDTITKLYVFAIIYNTLDYIQNHIENINFRIHSSCITSEMIGSVDCDCVQQLNGALEYFIQNKNGILFYLIQEGRGCGYIGKARACQITQFNSELTTFDAYKMLGMKDDYRSYHNIWEILQILSLNDKKYQILTNNPDKIREIKKFGMNVVSNIGLHYEPTIYNRKYLISKKEYGHFLNKVNTDNFFGDEKETGIFTNLTPFKMYQVIHENIYHVASYYLPIELKSQVEWFQMNLFYDVQLNTEFIHLTNEYKINECIKDSYFVYSENIFERFHKKTNRTFIEKMEHISKHGGSIVLFSKHNFGICEISEFTKIFSNRAVTISKFLVNMPTSLLLRMNQIIQTNDKKEWILENAYFGGCIKEQEPKDFSHTRSGLDENPVGFGYVTGMGSSKFHAKYFANKCNLQYIDFYELVVCEDRARQFADSNFVSLCSKLVIISQGINPSIINFIERNNISLLIHGNAISQEKREIIKKLGISTQEFIGDTPDDTLARITGIYSCFIQIDYFIEKYFNKKINPENRCVNDQLSHNVLSNYVLSNNVLSNYVFNKNVTYYFIFCNNESYVEILSNLLQELYSVDIAFVGNYIEFVHGPFQSSLYKYESMYMIFDENNNDEAIKKLINLLTVEKCKYMIFNRGNICDWIQTFCKWILYSKNIINQKNWKGKQTQSIIYNAGKQQ
jgi:GTP cyclohydrolase II